MSVGTADPELDALEASEVGVGVIDSEEEAELELEDDTSCRLSSMWIGEPVTEVLAKVNKAKLNSIADGLKTEWCSADELEQALLCVDKVEL